MTGYREHRKIAIGIGIALTLLLFFIETQAGITFLGASVFDTFDIFNISIPIVLIGFALLIYASLLPDIDIGTSKVYVWTVGALLLLAILFVLSGTHHWETVAILLFLFIILQLNHRGATHEYFWLFGLIAGVFFAFIFGGHPLIFLYVVIGYYSHMLGD